MFNRRSFLKFLGVAPAAAAVASLPEHKPPHAVALVKRKLGVALSPNGDKLEINEYVIRQSDGTEIDKFVGIPPGLPYIEEGPNADSPRKLAEATAQIEAHYAKLGVEPQRIDWKEIVRDEKILG